MKARVEQEDIFLRLGLLLVQVLKGEIFIDTIEVAYVFPGHHVTCLHVRISEITKLFSLTLGGNISAHARNFRASGFSLLLLTFLGYSYRSCHAQVLLLIRLLRNVRVGLGVHRQCLVIENTTRYLTFLAEYSKEEASLVIIVRVKAHAALKVQGVFHDSLPFLVVIVSVVLVEHGLAKCV